jgi:pimeloyl-ACP methyl ester carboxylesterase
MPCESSHLTVGGTRVKLLRGGSGEPLLYLHSAGGETLWMPFHDELSKHFELFAPAHPGFDSSEGLEKIDSIHDLVFHYIDFFDAMGWESVSIVGLSLGGWLGAELAVHHARRVKKLVLVDAAGLHVPGAPMAPLWEHARQPERLRRLLFADPDGLLARMLIQDPEDLPEPLLLLQLRAAEASARVGWNPYFHDPRLRERLGRVRAPTLILWGEQDRLIPLAHAHAYAAGIAGARLVVLPECGHMVPFERTAEFVAATVEFLKTQ